jgi:RNA polymerase sigma-70 factor (ECF subfamily)
MILRHDPLDHPEELIRRVYAYVAYWLGDGADAEDATSEVFENALRYKASYDPRKGEPLAWLLGIARRAVRAALARRPTPAAEPPEPAAREDLESETIQRLSLDAAVAGLGDRERELIALRYGADLAAKQIAELLGMSTNAVEVALHRALGRLRRELEAEEPPRDNRRSIETGRSSPAL